MGQEDWSDQMGCFSCAQRAKAIREGMKQIAQGKSPMQQVKQIGQTIRQDVAAIKARLNGK